MYLLVIFMTVKIKTMEESKYRSHPSISYSALKKVADNPSQLKKEKDISEYPSVKRGDVLDLMFEDSSLIDKKYAYFEGEIPSATTLKLAEHVISYCQRVGKTATVGLVLEIIEATNTDPDIDLENKFWDNLKDTTKTTKKNGFEIIKSKKDKLKEKFDNDTFWKYVLFQTENDKIIVEKELYDDVVQAYNTIKSHRHTSEIFDESRELIFQQEIYCEYIYDEEGNLVKVPIKVLPDVISIDHKKKIIYPYDFKFLTDYSVFVFPKRFRDMYYYLQAGLYTYAINDWVKKNWKGYRVFNYNFIVISTKNLDLPIVYDSFDYIHASKTGFDHYGRHFPGINQLMGDLEWHKEKDIWDYRRELYENKGVIKLRL